MYLKTRSPGVSDSIFVIYVGKKNPQAHEITLDSYTDYRKNYEHSYSDKKHNFHSTI